MLYSTADEENSKLISGGFVELSTGLEVKRSL